MLSVFFDGSYRPDVAAYGFIVKNEKGEVIHSESGRVTRGEDASGHVAEFEALYQSMLYIATFHGKEQVIFHGDSALVIDIMRGISRARKGRYLPYYQKVRALSAPFVDSRWTFQWISRAFNHEADDLAQVNRF